MNNAFFDGHRRCLNIPREDYLRRSVPVKDLSIEFPEYYIEEGVSKYTCEHGVELTLKSVEYVKTPGTKWVCMIKTTWEESSPEEDY